ncbi:hypothetical protein J40TS1_30820 [Paenibacillus montaniterrae]|uniref:DUF2178 domain-containing protein n=1 Tax=Paenibacillus montaniterrae TaxID=429341 RepID=A0A919YQ96_9BACL|nr:hypothetical protein [Paenibacillus montaniterrae]GIP17440.1 hypothetical protein J40TS1_30820 [Paenibacillus montaniterrae]
MSLRTTASIILMIASWAVILLAIYKISTDREVGLNEVIAISSLWMTYFTTMTWRGEEGAQQDEELDPNTTAQSYKLSYFLLTIFILVAMAVDMLMHRTTNILLLALLGFSMIILPMVEFIYARKEKGRK